MTAITMRQVLAKDIRVKDVIHIHSSFEVIIVNATRLAEPNEFGQTLFEFTGAYLDDGSISLVSFTASSHQKLYLKIPRESTKEIS